MVPHPPPLPRQERVMAETQKDATAAETQETYEKLTEARTTGEASQALAHLQVPRGSKLVYNRLAVPYEHFYDGQPQRWEPGESRLLPADVANWFEEKSVVSLEPVTGQEIRALVTHENEDYGVPYVVDLGPELISRDVSDNYVGKGTGGVPTKSKIIPVAGGGYDKGRPTSGKSRL